MALLKSCSSCHAQRDHAAQPRPPSVVEDGTSGGQGVGKDVWHPGQQLPPSTHIDELHLQSFVIESFGWQGSGWWEQGASQGAGAWRGWVKGTWRTLGMSVLAGERDDLPMPLAALFTATNKML